MNTIWHFPAIDTMPEQPMLDAPDYARLNADFRKALMRPENKILRYDKAGHPIFAAYVESDSNEMVTWGILAIGEWLQNRDTQWIASTYATFYSQAHHVFLNSPKDNGSEWWYLFYVNTLAGAIAQTLYASSKEAAAQMAASADTLYALGQAVALDFNQQGWRFASGQAFTNRDEYRQPDSLGGYAYNMLYSAVHWGKEAHLGEAVRAIERYEQFAQNPWYEIPNGSAALMASCYLSAHGHPTCPEISAQWVFDHEHGALQTGVWGGEEVNGLMMGWRGETRQDAMSCAYSMESLMPLQFILPAVRYQPQLAQAVAKYVRCLLSAFRLFYADGSRHLYETRPDLDASIPYERLDMLRNGHSPAACGDFHGHRSVYGAGYLFWVEALVRATSARGIFALDLSLTDWLSPHRLPVFLLSNPTAAAQTVSFTPAPVWQKLAPSLYSKEGALQCTLLNLEKREKLPCEGCVTLTLAPNACLLLALLPQGSEAAPAGQMLSCGQAELLNLLYWEE